VPFCFLFPFSRQKNDQLRRHLSHKLQVKPGSLSWTFFMPLEGLIVDPRLPKFFPLIRDNVDTVEKDLFVTPSLHRMDLLPLWLSHGPTPFPISDRAPPLSSLPSSAVRSPSFFQTLFFYLASLDSTQFFLPPSLFSSATLIFLLLLVHGFTPVFYQLVPLYSGRPLRPFP